MSSGKRDWHSHNEALVRRGELELDSSVVEEWNMELKKENDGKVGEPYQSLPGVVPHPVLREQYQGGLGRPACWHPSAF
jgi:hypothetical protein